MAAASLGAAVPAWLLPRETQSLRVALLGYPLGLIGATLGIALVGSLAQRALLHTGKARAAAAAAEEEEAKAVAAGGSSKKVKHALLSRGYTTTKRRAEQASVAAFIVAFALCALRLAAAAPQQPLWLTALAFAAGGVAADFFSGLVHWFADTYYTIDTPVVGSFIRSFREHHVDPLAITRHDWIETNADNMMATVPFLYGVQFVAGVGDGAERWRYFCFAFITLGSLLIALTNQIHSWAHEHKAPAFVRLLQRCRIVLHRGEHQQHHHDPFDTNYCITTGWLNAPFQRVRFWKRLEAAIGAVTGAVPRENDQFWRTLTADDLANGYSRSAAGGDDAKRAGGAPASEAADAAVTHYALMGMSGLVVAATALHVVVAM